MRAPGTQDVADPFAHDFLDRLSHRPREGAVAAEVCAGRVFVADEVGHPVDQRTEDGLLPGSFLGGPVHGLSQRAQRQDAQAEKSGCRQQCADDRSQRRLFDHRPKGAGDDQRSDFAAGVENIHAFVQQRGLYRVAAFVDKVACRAEYSPHLGRPVTRSPLQQVGEPVWCELPHAGV